MLLGPLSNYRGRRSRLRNFCGHRGPAVLRGKASSLVLGGRDGFPLQRETVTQPALCGRAFLEKQINC